MKWTRILTGLAALTLACSSVTAQTTRTWVTATGFYDDPNSWSPTGAPGAADTIQFSTNLSYTVQFDNLTGNRTAAVLSNSGGSPTFRRAGGGNSLLSITGTSTFTGAGVTQFIGDNAAARMILNLTGLVTIDNGRLFTIESHAQVNFGEMRVGTSAGSAELTIQPNALLEGLTLDIGRLGLASSLIQNGGSISLGILRVASINSGSTGTASIYGGTLTTNQIALAGPTGSSAGLTIYGGVVQSNTITTLGGTNPSSATVQVQSGGSFNNQTLNIQPTGSLTILGGSVFANSLSNRGSIRLESGELRFANYGLLDPAGAVEFISGTVHRTGSGNSTNDTTGPGALGFIFNGEAQVLHFGQKLISDNALQLNRPLTLDGGTLVVPNLINGSSNLNFRSGTLDVAAAFSISPTGILGSSVDLKPDSVLIARANGDIGSGATLLVRDGATFRYDQAFSNSGALVLDGVNARVVGSASLFSNLSNGLIRGHGEMTATLSNGGTIELSDVGALRFNGALTNTAAGTIRGRGRLVASAITHQGRMEFSGGFTDIESTLTNGATARVVVSGGGVLSFFGNVIHAAGADIRTGTGSRTVFLRPVTGSGTFSGAGLVQFENTYTPGSSPGLVTFGGDVELTDLAHLGIELAGTLRGSEYDALDVAGSVDIQGRLSLSILGGYVPAYGVGHRVIDASSRSGIFDQITGIELSPTRFLAVTYNGSGDVFVTAALPGDANLDGAVNFDDLLSLAQNYNATSHTWSQGDFGGNGAVEFNDLLILAQNYGSALLASGAWAMDEQTHASLNVDWARARSLVPEPAMVGLLGLGSVALLRRR
jgi:fibronectin-binding autotransporter adhesin